LILRYRLLLRYGFGTTQAWIDQKLSDEKFVAEARRRLSDLGWFMKCLKEPLARLANKQDGCQGVFWQGRYKSVPVLDDEALLATCAYIDLNQLAAGMAKTPEESDRTLARHLEALAEDVSSVES